MTLEQRIEQVLENVEVNIAERKALTNALFSMFGKYLAERA